MKVSIAKRDQDSKIPKCVPVSQSCINKICKATGLVGPSSFMKSQKNQVFAANSNKNPLTKYNVFFPLMLPEMSTVWQKEHKEIFNSPHQYFFDYTIGAEKHEYQLLTSFIPLYCPQKSNS